MRTPYHPRTVEAYGRRVLATLVTQKVLYSIDKDMTPAEAHDSLDKPPFNISQTEFLLEELVKAGDAKHRPGWRENVGQVESYEATRRGVMKILGSL